MDAEEARTIGRWLREIRHWRGKSLQLVAELAGISGSYLSRIERGERTLDRRSILESLATALRVAPSDITGQPYPPSNEDEAVAHAAAQALRAVLRDIEVDELVTATPPRSLSELRGEVAAVNAASAACDYRILGQTVPDLIAESYVLAEVDGSTEERRIVVIDPVPPLLRIPGITVMMFVYGLRSEFFGEWQARLRREETHRAAVAGLRATSSGDCGLRRSVGMLNR